MSQAIDQAHFMIACGQTVNVFNPEQAFLYARLVDEEFKEFSDAINELRLAMRYPGARNLVDLVAQVTDALVDLQYVCNGVGHSLGIHMDKAWDEVHRSNMTKVCPETGRVEKREDGKVQKPAHYEPPDLIKVVRESWLHAPAQD